MADRVGLNFTGEGKDLAVELATRALECALTLQRNKSEPIYFFSDSSPLTYYMTHRDVLVENSTAAIVDQLPHLVSRVEDPNEATLHLGLQHGHPPKDYFATFCDLYLAIGARCVGYGLGGWQICSRNIQHPMCLAAFQQHLQEDYVRLACVLEVDENQKGLLLTRSPTSPGRSQQPVCSRYGGTHDGHQASLINRQQ